MLRTLLIQFAGLLLSLRYRVHLKGLEHLHDRKDKGGILLLPNHPAELDPVILMTVIPEEFQVRPVVAENFFYIGWVDWLLNIFKAFPIPNFNEGGNEYKRRQTEKTFNRLMTALQQKENLLFYPSGKLKRSGREEVGGASGLHKLIEGVPEAYPILVRTTGLWGSLFSTYFTGGTPNLNLTMKKACKIILQNALFFTPRREVTIEFHPLSGELPEHASKIDVNHILEEWYNRPFGIEGEPVVLKPYYFWSKKLPVVEKPAKINPQKSAGVSEEVRKKVIEEIAGIAKKPVRDIKESDHLSRDLGLDSLDTLELTAFLDSQFSIKEILPEDMESVSSILAFIAEHEARGVPVEINESSPWPVQKRPQTRIPEGATIGEVFLRSCFRMGKLAACGDDMSGVLSYFRLKMAALILSKKIKNLPGDSVGILLPATVGSTLLILACYLAKKIPVMMNWTLGSKHLQEEVEVSGVKCILTSARFLSRAHDIDLEGIDDLLMMLENIKKEITVSDKLNALTLSFYSPDRLLRYLHLTDLSENDPAVVLFTSGTESLPKAVPLSHKNLLSNQRAALSSVSITGEDIMHGFLPPFHSFGFSVTGLLPILAGFRVAYFPDPTNGPRLAQSAIKWAVSVVCGAPTFIKSLLNSSKPEQLKAVRLFVSGAEKAPKSLYEQVSSLGKNVKLIEGYGITECGPILTLNKPDEPPRGVGKPLPGVELLVVHPDTFSPLPYGENGLVLARGPNIFNGYLCSSQNPPFVELNGISWYKTGDLGILDEGSLILSGRMKRFVKIGGEMINLNALEEAITASLLCAGHSFEASPFLAVCSVEKEEEKTQLILFISAAISLNDVNGYLKEKGFSNLTKIAEVRQIPALPLLGTGKVNYRALATLL